jgi:hypothetical protein
MSVTTDLNTINDSYEQAKIALKYRRIFEDCYTRLKSLDAEVEAVAADVKFSNIPTDVRQALNRYWQIVKAFNTAIEADTEIIEMFDWK